MLPTSVSRALIGLLATMVLTTMGVAQGIELKSAATVWSGSASTCSQPATIRFDSVRDATPEWQTIRSEGVKKGSARYSLLISQMNDRIRDACQKVADDQSRDCVVSDGDIKSSNGLTPIDITSSVVTKLESGQPTS
ncbi:MAG: hypothetical protein U1F36_12470 [Planctomycetota bacterium]